MDLGRVLGRVADPGGFGWSFKRGCRFRWIRVEFSAGLRIQADLSRVLGGVADPG